MQVVVVKVGGSLAGQHLHIVARLIERVQNRGDGIVLVHGGGPRISESLDAVGLTMPWHEGQRVTSSEAAQVVHRVLCQQVNREIIAALTSQSIAVHKVCGADGLLIGAPLPGLEQTADVADVAVNVLLEDLALKRVPVVAPVGVDTFGEYCNINADLAAASIATALNAERIIFLTDVEGIYYDWENKLRLEDVSLKELSDWLDRDAFSAGMIPKVRAVLRALRGDVPCACVVHGGQEEAVLAAGTMAFSHSWQVAGGTRILNR